MIPMRCFTCNKFVAHLWEPYQDKKDGSAQYKHLLDEMGLKRICCRRMFLTQVDVIDDTAMYGSKCEVMDESNTRFNSEVTNCRTVSCE